MSVPLAVLIDAENISASLFHEVKHGVAKLGDAIVWQVHGDLIDAPTRGWHEVAKTENLDVRHQPQAGKNCADIAMTIAAMDLLREGVVRGICLVSSDSDFVPLARRLRAGNMAVHGFGCATTRAAFRSACTTFCMLTHNAVVPAQSTVTPDAMSPTLSPTETRRLHEILAESCGPSGRLDGTTAAALLRDRVPHIAERLVIKGHFFRHLAATGVVDIVAEGAQRFISIHPTVVAQPLKVVPG